MYIYSDRVNFTDVAEQILPDAYRHASGDGRYTVSKRQLYYACREAFKEETDRELEYGYFAGTLLVQYLNRHHPSWKITADPRGTLTIPNAGHDERIPVGTIQIEDHLQEVRKQVDPFDIDKRLKTEWPSLAAGQRYQAVLYIEKEGFQPLLDEASIAERFDLAILSCKGQSVVAARRFVDEVCQVGGGVQLFVVHDFDKSGFEIAQRLTSVSDWALDNDRVAYEFQHDIDVHDLGLRFADVEHYNLGHERCEFNGHFASDSICTQEEREFLESGQRVELNAFTSPQFIEWLEEKLSEHIDEHFVPVNDDLLVAAYRRGVAIALVNKAIEDTVPVAIKAAMEAEVPTNLSELLAECDEPWDEAIYDIVKQAFS